MQVYAKFTVSTVFLFIELSANLAEITEECTRAPENPNPRRVLMRREAGNEKQVKM